MYSSPASGCRAHGPGARRQPAARDLAVRGARGGAAGGSVDLRNGLHKHHSGGLERLVEAAAAARQEVEGECTAASVVLCCCTCLLSPASL